MKYYHETKVINKGKSDEYIYDYGYDINKLPLNKPVWGFAYDINDETEQRRLICSPVLGEISEDDIEGKWGGRYFFPYKKGTKQKRKSGAVNFKSRYYADTYKEAVEMYNELVQQRINNLNRMAKEAEKHKIKIDMSKECGFKYFEYWNQANHLRTMSQDEWSKWYDNHCGKCQYMCEICMHGEKQGEENNA